MADALIGLIVRSAGSGPLPARKARPRKLRNQSCIMKRTMEVIAETVRDPKHPFRKLDVNLKKPLRNRYERRKVKEYLHLGDWLGEQV
jgi:hypothetical protein